ncbi:MAG: hypothetical protein KDA46_09500 [Parvularculaceae bacterium]|nr:hypothetical protein [Parvularculaceae bacterium]
MRLVFAAFLALPAACAAPDGAASEGAEPADAFLAALSAHCGDAYSGRVVSDDPQDADFAAQSLVMQVRTCSDDEVRIPFHVGEDRSRTWVITRTDAGLRLKHDHRHEDGSEDAVTQYGGDSELVTPTRAEFPADEYSIGMFRREGLDASVGNVWAVEITPDIYAYELSREGRFFRVEFDLTAPVAPPPAPWGADAE